MDNTAWDAVDGLVRWLDDSSVLPVETERLLRVMKLQEEVGETAQAIIGALGQNPRKGVVATWDDVHRELCDVILTAMVALRSLTSDAEQVFTEHLANVSERCIAANPGRTRPA